MIKTPLKSFPNDKTLSSFRIHLLKSPHESWNHYFVLFWETLQFEIAVPRVCTFHMDLHPPTHVQLEIYSGTCLGYVVFECHATFQIKWESSAHKDQQTTCLGHVIPKPQRWQMSRFSLWIGSTINRLRAHSHIWNNPIIANYGESKLSTWKNMTNFNMNKTSSWNNQENIWTSCQRSQNKLLMTKLWLHRTSWVRSLRGPITRKCHMEWFRITLMGF